MHKRRGQTILEYTIIVIVMIGVIITMKNYIKRGLQGRWKDAADQIGGQYDPTTVNSQVNYTTASNAVSIITVVNESVNGVDGQYTNRLDASNSVDTKTGFQQVGD